MAHKTETLANPTQANPAASESSLVQDNRLPAERLHLTTDTLQVHPLPTHLDVAAAGSGEAAPHLAAESSAGVAGGGETTDMGDFISEIARCLPSDLRPKLTLSKLFVEIGPDGALKSAPYIQSTLPVLSDGDRLSADRVVQAALQCGPYDKPNFRNRVISVVADFSAVQPTVVAANLRHGEAGAESTRP